MSTGTWRHLVDPDLQGVLGAIPEVDFDDYATFRESSARAAAARSAEVDTTGVTITEHVVDPAGPGGCGVRMYEPEIAGDRQKPALLHIHGGGFVSGNTDSSHLRNVELARVLGVTIASVDYRLAPEHPYPAALDDCVAALRWLAGRAASLSVDPARIAVHGVSAGAGLATAVAMRSRDGDLPDVCFQYLAMPILDDRLVTPSMRRHLDTPIWNRTVAETSWRHHLGALTPGAPDVPVLSAPGRAAVAELVGMPPTYIAVMALDPLCDEGLHYAQNLLAAGVSVEAHVFPGTFHASSSLAPGAEVSRRQAAEEVAVLARALGVPSPAS